MGISHPNMSFAPFARGYGYPAAQFGGYGGDSFGYAPYGAYGPSLEEVKKIREAEEKAFKDAEAKRQELMEAEKKQYEEYCEAQKKAVDDAVEKEKEFYEKVHLLTCLFLPAAGTRVGALELHCLKTYCLP